MTESLFDEEEFLRWMKQAEHTLTSAQGDAAEGDYGWACFKAQQAAEYAAKALLRGLGLPAFGHSILGLVGEMEEQGLRILQDIEAKQPDMVLTTDDDALTWVGLKVNDIPVVFNGVNGDPGK